MKFADDFIPKAQREWDQIRAALLHEFDWKCAYCDKPINWSQSAIEHQIARARGGTDHFVNLTISCKRCNSKKGTKSPLEWMAPDEYAELQALQGLPE